MTATEGDSDHLFKRHQYLGRNICKFLLLIDVGTVWNSKPLLYNFLKWIKIVCCNHTVALNEINSDTKGK